VVPLVTRHRPRPRHHPQGRASGRGAVSPATEFGLPSRWTDRWTPADRLRWLRVTVALASLAGLVLSATLWLSARWYPLTPISAALPSIPPPIDLWLFLLLLVLAVAVLVSSSRWPALALVGLIGVLCLWDQSRWQPWVYQYTFMLAALALAPRAVSGPTRASVALDTCRFIVASLYVWSGLQKLNAGFVLEVVPYLSGPLVARFSESATTLSYALGLSIAVFEAGIGAGLLTRSCRHGAVLGAVIMHLAIIVALGPWGRDWNRVILPWNVAMIGMVSILFWRIGAVTARDIFWPAPGARAVHVLVVVLFGVMPLLSLADAWDSYLSWSLYSGNTRRADIAIADAARPAIPPEIRRYVEPAVPGWSVLAFETWSMGELHVPPYPETRVFLNVARSLCRYAGYPAGIWLRISEKPDRLTGARRAKTYACSELRSLGSAEASNARLEGADLTLRLVLQQIARGGGQQGIPDRQLVVGVVSDVGPVVARREAPAGAESAERTFHLGQIDGLGRREPGLGDELDRQRPHPELHRHHIAALVHAGDVWQEGGILLDVGHHPVDQIDGGRDVRAQIQMRHGLCPSSTIRPDGRPGVG